MIVYLLGNVTDNLEVANDLSTLLIHPEGDGTQFFLYRTYIYAWKRCICITIGINIVGSDKDVLFAWSVEIFDQYVQFVLIMQSSRHLRMGK